jgi:hypothetical protein
MSKPPRREELRFWEVDVMEVLRHWFQDLSVFMRTLLMFLGLALPVVISGLLLWLIQWYRGDS